MAKSVAKLVKKFSDEKFGKLGVAGLGKDMQRTMAVLLENQTNFSSDLLMENDAIDANETTNGNIDYDASQGDRYKPVALAMVRRAIPQMWTTKWVPTQAIQAPVGLAYALRFYDDQTKEELFKPQNQDMFLPYGGNVRKTVRDIVASAVLSGSGVITDAEAEAFTISLSADGQSLVVNGAVADSDGSGTPVADVNQTIPFADISGATTADAESWLIGSDNYDDNTGGANEIRQVGLKLETIPVYARTRKLGATFSLENAHDLKSMHGLDLHKEMVDTLHAEVASEIDRECLWRMKRTAVIGAGGAGRIITVDIPDANTDVSFGRYSAEQIDTLVKAIVYQANDIYRTTRRATGNFVVCSPAIASALQFAPGFTQAKGYEANVEVSRQLEVGKLANGIVVYMDADSRSANEWALIGLKGSGDRDGGIIMSPYMMGVQAEGQSQADFSPRVGVMSRYAFTDNLLGAGRYYRYCEFTGIDNLNIKF